MAHFWCTSRALTVIVLVVVLLRGGLDHRHRHGVGFSHGAAREKEEERQAASLLVPNPNLAKRSRRRETGSPQNNFIKNTRMRTNTCRNPDTLVKPGVHGILPGVQGILPMVPGIFPRVQGIFPGVPDMTVYSLFGIPYCRAALGPHVPSPSV